MDRSCNMCGEWVDEVVLCPYDACPYLPDADGNGTKQKTCTFCAACRNECANM